MILSDAFLPGGRGPCQEDKRLAAAQRHWQLGLLASRKEAARGLVRIETILGQLMLPDLSLVLWIVAKLLLTALHGQGKN
uniref:Uncharacterized protein n=1 Tax=Bracon brevicornis TaxID=1563983 RepID=A0A6V7KLB6_9HYME